MPAYTRSHFAWIAFIALLLRIMTPGVPHSMPSGSLSAGILGEICSAQATQKTGSSERQDAPANHVHADCPLCLAHAGDLSLPAQNRGMPVKQAIATTVLITQTAQVAVSSIVWRGLYSRDPPVLS
jgi:hypothetical protein